MGKIRNRGRNDTKKSLFRQGSVVGERHEQREERGNLQVISDKALAREDYDLSWFHPTVSQNKIIQSMYENECTLVDAPSG